MKDAERKKMNKENKMGTAPIERLLISMSFPMMVSMLVQAFYNIADSIFVSYIDAEQYGLQAVSLAFPIQSLMIAVAVGTSVGITSSASKALGEKNLEKANAVASNGLFLEWISYVVFAIVGLTISRAFFASQTQIPQVRGYGVVYLTVCCCGSIGMFTQIALEKLLQSTGRTIYTMYTQLIGAVVNIILDPLLIFGIGFFPRLEVLGAALATIIGQCAGATAAIYFNLKYNEELKVNFKGFVPNIELILQIYTVGFPSIVMQAVGSVMTYGMNLILEAFSSAQTVFGVYFKLQSFIFMPVFGLNSGMVPIIAYNFGAEKKNRVLDTMKYASLYAVGIMLLGLMIMQTVPAKLMGLFNANPELVAIGVPALRTISIGFVVAGFCIVAGSVFQALGNGFYSMIVSVARQLFVLLPVAYLLSLSGNVNYIWWSFPIAEIMSLVMTVFFLVRINKKIIVHIGEKA